MDDDLTWPCSECKRENHAEASCECGAWLCTDCGNLNFRMRQFCNVKSCQKRRDDDDTGDWLFIQKYRAKLEQQQLNKKNGQAERYRETQIYQAGGPMRFVLNDGMGMGGGGMNNRNMNMMGQMMMNQMGGQVGGGNPMMRGMQGNQMNQMMGGNMSPMMGGMGGDQMGIPGMPGKPGDWSCPNCGNLNYASREICNRTFCGYARFPWNCPACGNDNFVGRFLCNRKNCQQPHPAATLKHIQDYGQGPEAAKTKRFGGGFDPRGNQNQMNTNQGGAGGGGEGASNNNNNMIRGGGPMGTMNNRSGGGNNMTMTNVSRATREQLMALGQQNRMMASGNAGARMNSGPGEQPTTREREPRRLQRFPGARNRNDVGSLEQIGAGNPFAPGGGLPQEGEEGGDNFGLDDDGLDGEFTPGGTPLQDDGVDLIDGKEAIGFDTMTAGGPGRRIGVGVPKASAPTQEKKQDAPAPAMAAMQPLVDDSGKPVLINGQQVYVAAPVK
eukprot:g19090.t1